MKLFVFVSDEPFFDVVVDLFEESYDIAPILSKEVFHFIFLLILKFKGCPLTISLYISDFSLSIRNSEKIHILFIKANNPFRRAF